MRNSAPPSIAACAFAAQVDVNESASLQSMGRNITPSGRLPDAVCPQLYAQLTCLRGRQRVLTRAVRGERTRTRR